MAVRNNTLEQLLDSTDIVHSLKIKPKTLEAMALAPEKSLPW
jgi:hypothetical protein